MTKEREEDLSVAIGCAVVDTLREATCGMPAGHLYAACMNYMTLHAFEDMMARLCTVGLVRKAGQEYFAGSV